MEADLVESARVVWEVAAGMVPGQPMGEFGRRFGITSREWEEADDKLYLLLRRQAEVDAYAGNLIINSASGNAPNWVRVDYIWLW